VHLKLWTPDQQRITPQGRRAAQHPGNADSVRTTQGDSRHPLKLADHRKQLFARGFPLGPNMRIKAIDSLTDSPGLRCR
jgi:hypothetical protein